jgi:hypothetical protein
MAAPECRNTWSVLYGGPKRHEFEQQRHELEDKHRERMQLEERKRELEAELLRERRRNGRNGVGEPYAGGGEAEEKELAALADTTQTHKKTCEPQQQAEQEERREREQEQAEREQLSPAPDARGQLEANGACSAQYVGSQTVRLAAEDDEIECKLCFSLVCDPTTTVRPRTRAP